MTKPVLLRTLTLLLASAVVAAAFGIGAQTASAAQTPCWKELLNDWYDGRIDGSYPARCYREAIRNLPADVDAYSHAREDIERALLAAIRRNGGSTGPNDIIAPEPADEPRQAPQQPRPASPPAEAEDETETEPGTAPPPAAVPLDPGGEDDEVAATPTGPRGDDSGVLAHFRPGNADEIPLPLLVLAGLALVLLAAAAAGFVARQVQARRLRAVPQRSAPPKP